MIQGEPEGILEIAPLHLEMMLGEMHPLLPNHARE
jgi:hypothetical protein